MHPPSCRARVFVALLVAILAGSVQFFNAQPNPRHPEHHTDFAYPWNGVRLLQNGINPYENIGPGRAVDLEGPLVYPMPALIVLWPLGSLNVATAGAIFTGVSFGILAFLMSRTAWYPLLVLGSFPAAYTMRAGQSAALLSAALLAPPLAGLFALRPNIGLAAFAYHPTSRWLAGSVLGGGLLVLLSFVVLPSWLSDVMAAAQRATRPEFSAGAQAATYRPFLLLPGGFLALLALLRWRRPEARLVAALSCVPQTLIGYDLLPILCVVPESPREAFALTIVSHLVVMGHSMTGPYATGLDAMRGIGVWQVWFLFAPCVYLILRRPNIGSVPR